MELYVKNGGFVIQCAGCQNKVKTSEVKKIGKRFYCQTCQEFIYDSLTGKSNDTEKTEETTI